MLNAVNTADSPQRQAKLLKEPRDLHSSLPLRLIAFMSLHFVQLFRLQKKNEAEQCQALKH